MAHHMKTLHFMWTLHHYHIYEDKIACYNFVR